MFNCAKLNTKECVLRAFLHDGKIDDTIILINVNKMMGLDVMFVVSDDLGSQRLVAAQLKNVGQITCAEVTKALHPGTQHLLNNQRDAILQRKSKSKDVISMFNNPGSGSFAWHDFIQFHEKYPQLTSNWIRLAVVARDINSNVHRFARTGIFEWLKKKFPISSRVSFLQEYNSSRQTYYDSPIYFLSLNSASWLTGEIRGMFVSPSDDAMTVVANLHVWIPVSIDQTLEYVMEFQRFRTL